MVDQQLTIPAGSAVGHVECAALPVVRGDLIREGNETFSVTFQVENPNDVIQGQAFVTVVIQQDGDGKKNPLA